ncbi:exodeoxyribonuclease VII small subunit [Schaalia sp. lx-100]|uniref:exodeoxyribonuclease VII small subunit n=1 Tax=Schaalia sp. lx-100 TaxID=2899081 RepID=UPI001E42B1A3|nr:exodeoxyribonuclease VII small subunit [Schaalia sp. lx-100]MCD4558125.1 exodeoxyribonuclease VII small subunit [Schaalia sp. lx-100]
MIPEQQSESVALTYEEARDELIGIVRQLENGQAPLEDTLKLWERGEALATHCRSILDTARARLENTHAGSPTTEN